MSIKSKKSKSRRRVVATIIAGSIAITGCTYYADALDVGSKVFKNDLEITEYHVSQSETERSVQTNATNTTTLSTTTTTSTSTSKTKKTDTTTTTGTTSTTYEDVVQLTYTDTVVTDIEFEAPTEEVVETFSEVCEDVEPIEVYTVYKPSTHYIHSSDCVWANDECYEITSTEGIEARKCTECNPSMEIITPYTEPVSEAHTNTAIQVTDYEYTMLVNLVAGEYGSDWVSTYDKGAVVATVIHRMQEGTRWTNGAEATIYNVIAAPYQYDGKYLSSYESSNVTQSCRDAVDYALNNMSEYEYYTNPDGTCVYMINSFCGDGTYNWFSHR